MCLAVSGPCQFPVSLLAVEFPLFPVLPGNGLALKFHAYAVKGVALVLHDVEAVYDYCGVWKGLPHYGIHRIRLVHRHLLDGQSLLLGDPHQHLYRY